MNLNNFRNRAGDHIKARGGLRLLVSSFTALYWYFPKTGGFRAVHRTGGRYYGIGLADGADELLAVSRPDQERDDVLLKINHLSGDVSGKWQLDSRDTHQAIRDGSRLLVTDSFRGRLLVYSVPEIKLIHSYDNFDYAAHLNSVRVFGGDLYLLTHNFGASALSRLDPASGKITDTWPVFGQGAHDIIPFEDSFLTLDSLRGGLLRVNRASKEVRTLWSHDGMFTKGLCVEDGIAYFGVSRPSQRDDRYQVVCEIVALDLRTERIIWRKTMPFPGLVNAVTTPRQLACEKTGSSAVCRQE